MKIINLLTIFLCILLFTTSIYAAKKSKNKDEVQDIGKITWIGKTWNEGAKFYFSGISEANYSLKKAKELAYNDAALNAAKYLGIKISNETSSELTNNNFLLNEKTASSLEETFISSAIIKEFFFTEKNNRYTAYILLEIDKEILKKEQERKEKNEQEKIEENKRNREKIEENKNLGPYNIISSENLEPISGDIKILFEKYGYEIEDINNYNSTPIYINIIHENLKETINNLISYEIRVEVKFNDKRFMVESKKVNVSPNRVRMLALKDILKKIDLKISSISK